MVNRVPTIDLWREPPSFDLDKEGGSEMSILHYLSVGGSSEKQHYLRFYEINVHPEGIGEHLNSLPIHEPTIESVKEAMREWQNANDSEDSSDNSFDLIHRGGRIAPFNSYTDMVDYVMEEMEKEVELKQIYDKVEL